MGAKVKDRGHKVTLDGNTQSAISLFLNHSVFLKFGWLVVLDKGKTF